MTHKKYYDSSYTREWTAKIQHIMKREDGLYVLLDETAFYPEGGGQPGDTGMIGESRVVDTITENGDVLHRIEASSNLPDEPGTEVSCVIDWERRFDHMQQHSGQHLLSATCLDLLQAPTLSFHLGEEYATIDIDRAQWTEEELDQVEQEVNTRIMRNLPVKSYWVSREEADRLPLVKAPSVEGNIRIVEIEGIEYNACGGTHVSATGELGLIKLLRAEKQKGHLRLTFKVGFRALREFAIQTKVLSALSAKLSVPKEELVERLEKFSEEDRRKQAELHALRKQLDEYTVRELLEAAERTGGPVAELFSDRTTKDLQSLAAALTSRTAQPVLLGSLSEHKLILAHGGETGFSCGSLFKETLSSSGGRGGGNDKSAQAAFGSESELTAFYEMLKVRLNGGAQD
ncbi:alanyl-tRNA editing protein [Saccharibacillus kuerlensis]|uniref:Alanyl-tRNA editing protein n=1 Tax=Saccharibacillus kuerlensis TaxID=459527 RepID=A0ABQ2KXL7_9BACL|nr:alanyl-tRNA editing protein [Saccharibacillus kuerlensis]GGN95880.1 alanyl-tRNA editing protein [Saccharibacillus kuerlensis]